jgi:hypothetical protein
MNEELLEEIEELRAEIGFDLVNKFLPYILPTDQRLGLLEWLLETIEPQILDQVDIMISNMRPEENLENALRQFGFKGFDISGSGGLSSSINDLWKLTEMTMHHRIVENQEDPYVAMRGNLEILDQIATHQKGVFKDSV